MLARYHGLEINEYDADTPVVWSVEDLEKVAAGPEATRVRRAVLEYDGPGNLATALEVADIAITHLCSKLQIDAVPYKWGLYRGRISPDKPQRDDSSRHPLIPEGYSLVAEVDIQRGLEPLDTMRQVDIHKRWRRYTAPPRTGYRMRDAFIWQIKQRAVTMAGQAALRPILPDVEPRLTQGSVVL